MTCAGVERPQAGQVEDRAEIDVERVVALARVDLDAAGQVCDRRLHERAVVRRRAGADVDRRGRQVRAEHRLLAVGDPGDLVRAAAGSSPDPRGCRSVRCCRGTCRRVPRLRLELELVGHVLLAVAVVVHLQLVEHVVGELVEVRAAGRLLEWDVVGDDRHRVGPVGTHERVHVRVVRGRVLTDDGRLAMARRLAFVRARAAHERSREPPPMRSAPKSAMLLIDSSPPWGVERGLFAGGGRFGSADRSTARRE